MSSAHPHRSTNGVHFPRALAAVSAGLLLLAAIAAPARAARSAKAPSAQEEVTRNFDKTLSLPAGHSFAIEHKFGEVKIHGESGREVKIHATIRVQLASRSEAESYANQIRIEVEQNGQGIQVRTVYPDKTWFSTSHRVSYSVDYDIALPSDSPVSVRNGSGWSTANSTTPPSRSNSRHAVLNWNRPSFSTLTV